MLLISEIMMRDTMTTVTEIDSERLTWPQSVFKSKVFEVVLNILIL